LELGGIVQWLSKEEPGFFIGHLFFWPIKKEEEPGSLAVFVFLQIIAGAKPQALNVICED